MYRKMNNLYFLIGVLVALLAGVNIAYAKSCDDVNVVSYCGTCRSQYLCPSFFQYLLPLLNKYEVRDGESLVPCNDDQICIEEGNFAYCGTSTSVCQCPLSTGVSSFCDPYNPRYVMICLNGIIDNLKICAGNDICENGDCVPPQPTTTPAIPEGPVPDCSDCEFQNTWRDCSSYYVCKDCQLYIFNCNNSEIAHISQQIVTCVGYKPFECPSTGSGQYGDPYKCETFYYCTNGTQVGPPQSCSDGQQFDQTTGTCIKADDKNCKYMLCTPCTDENLTIAINCTSYYHCLKGEDNIYYTEIKTCPPGLFFDPTQKFCTTDVQNCS